MVKEHLLFSCETQWVIPRGQDSPILTPLVVNHSAEFHSTCLLTELAITNICYLLAGRFFLGKTVSKVKTKATFFPD